MVLTIAAAVVASTGAQAPTTVRLTSPLGRTAMAGTIRVVAQVVTPAPAGVVPVRFYVDGQLLGEDTDGPPYVTEWVDENPYEPREIRVEVEDGLGGVVADAVSLAPLDVSEQTHVASVLVEASVTDRSGRAVATLAADDFTLLEDGLVQTLDLVQLQRMPTQFTVLVDSSQSMARRIEMVRTTARRLTTRLREGDLIAVAPFRRSVEVITGPTDDPTTIANAIAEIRATGGTAILDALGSLPEFFARPDGRHVIILLTDGYDEHSVTTLAHAIDALQRLHATVYVVGIGGVAGISLKGELLLRQIAQQTGGRAFFPSRETQLPEVHEAIASEVYSRYLLTYTPINQEPDGRYRTIELTTADATHKVAARAGYYAPKPPPVKPTIEFSIMTSAEQDVTLGAADLMVTEDGVEQTIESFYEASTPMSIVLALDGSGSMRRALDAVKEAATTFVAALRPTDPLSLVQFADEVTLVHDFSTERQSSVEAIAAHRALGGTALFDALHESMALLGRQDRRRAVVLVTDGRDEDNPGTGPGSRRSLAEVLSQIRETETTIYTIGLGPNVDRAALQQIADRSGGSAYFPEDVSRLAEQYQRVLEDLRRRYVLSYQSTNPKRDGSWREVTITTTAPGVSIRSRGGFAAPLAGTATIAEQR
jgi:Ca-activated chloride channel homolog